MNNHSRLLYGFILVALLLAQSACSGSSADVHLAGETVQIEKNIILTLQSWDLSNDRLLMTFTVHNDGTEKFLMRGTFSILHQQKGQKDLASEPFVKFRGLDDCASTLYGYVLPDENWSGTVCWRNLAENGITYPVQVKYSLHRFDLFRGSVAVWKLDTHTLGDTITIKDGITITMDSASVTHNGDALQADFTVNNQSTQKFSIDGAFAFQILHQQDTGQDRPPDLGNGSCGPTMMGDIQPGQTMSGHICWTGLTDSQLSFPLQVEYVVTPYLQAGAIWVVNQ